jgi:serine/threonine protein kinase
VSPQNILVSYDGEVKVVDFGIAKAAAEVRATETQVGVLKGKFAYMAPEQVLGERIDRRADIFALGSVLFEALSGQRLFTGENDLIVLERVRDAVLPNLRAMLTPEAERILPVLNRALSLLPDMRYTYASEMAEALSTTPLYCGPMATSMHPIAWQKLALRRARRNLRRWCMKAPFTAQPPQLKMPIGR